MEEVFRQYDPIGGVKEAIRKYKKGEDSFKEVLKSMAHLVYPYQLEKAKGRERGYVYFQEFIPDCKFDIRVQVVHDKCYAMSRFMRKNDFRASGSGDIEFDGSKMPVSTIKHSFDVAEIMQTQTLAIDWLPFRDSYLIAEVSYAWGIADGELDFGYWDRSLNWHSGAINPYGWMVELVLKGAENQELIKNISIKDR